MKKLLTICALFISAAHASEVDCLAEAIYHESRGEPTRGQLAVAQTVLNRQAHQHFPNTICEVVNQKGQFTYRKTNRHRNSPQHNLANSILAKGYALENFSALYFHNQTVSPAFSRTKKRIERIGNHTFYR